MDNYERIDKLEEAKELLEQVYDLVESAISDLPCKDNVKAYWLDHLKIMTSENHGFLSRDLNIDKIIEMVEEKEKE